MTQQQAFLPALILRHGNKTAHNILAVLSGIALIAVAAQIAVPLPFTPVPITGQTWGVAMVSLLWGRSRGVAVVGGYLSLGLLGSPLFALGKSGPGFGPTSGYLLGMLSAAFVMGSLADRGWTKKFFTTWLAAAIGSTITFTCGVLGLALFVPASELITSGVLPFIPGDLLKTLLACSVVHQITKTR